MGCLLMKGASDMRLIEYKVIKTYFEYNELFQSMSGVIDIQPAFERQIIKVDDTKYRIKLTVKITSQMNKKPIPFEAEAVIMALFEFDQWEDSSRYYIAINNATAIMFPYLRTLLSTITTNGNIPPYCLPIMNVTKLFGEPSITKNVL